MTAFRIFIYLFALIPLYFGVTGVWGGAEALLGEVPNNCASCFDGPSNNAVENQFRYLSGIYIGISAMLFYVVQDIKGRAILYRAVVLAVFIGGCARVVSYLTVGPPPAEMMVGMALELLVPLSLLWLNRVIAD